MLSVEFAQTIAGVVMVAMGKGFTVKVAAVDVTVPHGFVKVARNRFPLSVEVGENVYVLLVAPATLANVAPPSLLTCHCTEGAGVPLAEAVNETGLAAQAV